MTIIQKLTAIWNEDNLLRRVVKNSSHLISGNVISSALIFIQGIIAVRLIGFANWGIIAAIQTFSSNINRLLSFRMSEVVVRYLAPDLAAGNKQEAAALVKAAALVEAVTSTVAFTVLASTAYLAARYFTDTTQTAPWFILYGLTLLSLLVFETSTGVLQATHRFNHLGRLTIIQSIITASIILTIFLLDLWMGERIASYLVPGILLAYVLGKAFYGAGITTLAFRELNLALGKGWWRVSLRRLPGKRSIAYFALNTNLYSTLNIAFRDNILLYVALLLSPLYAGFYKLAMSFISYMTQILDPLINPTYSEIARTVAARQWDLTLRLLRRVSAITSAVVLAIVAFSALTGWWLIPLVWTQEARPVYPVLLILLAGYGFASIFQWNRSLLLSLGKSGFPVVVTALTGVVELGLIFTLVPRYGYLMMAAILSGFFIISIGLSILRGLLEVHRRQGELIVRS
jgi:O-antigen/teichoic acid export membrane protein